MASETLRAIEAIVMVADVPVEPQLLAQLLEVSPGRVEECCAELAASYREEDRGFELVRVAGGYRFQSHADLAPYVERYILDGQTARLSAAALETLAIVAYKQPVSRAQVAAVRGVNVDAVMRTLQSRGFIAEVGRDPGPGQAVLYGTTTLLLERLGLDHIDSLPPLAQFVPGPEIMDALEHSLRTERARADANGATEPDPTAAQPDQAAAGPEWAAPEIPGGAAPVGAAVPSIGPASSIGPAPDAEPPGEDPTGDRAGGPDDRPGDPARYRP